MFGLVFQFFIVLLAILLAELILLILFFVYMDKVNLTDRSNVNSHTTPALAQAGGKQWLAEPTEWYAGGLKVLLFM